MREHLSDEWIDAIFARLTLRYGKAFLNRWEGINIDAVKADWACALAGLQDKPNAIRYALNNMPAEYPPTVGRFRDVCNRAPEYTKVLPRPVASEETRNAAREKIKAAFAAGNAGDPKAWAHKIMARHEAGEKVRRISLEFAKEALNL